MPLESNPENIRPRLCRCQASAGVWTQRQATWRALQYIDACFSARYRGALLLNALFAPASQLAATGSGGHQSRLGTVQAPLPQLRVFSSPAWCPRDDSLWPASIRP